MRRSSSKRKSENGIRQAARQQAKSVLTTDKVADVRCENSCSDNERIDYSGPRKGRRRPRTDYGAAKDRCGIRARDDLIRSDNKPAGPAAGADSRIISTSDAHD